MLTEPTMTKLHELRLAAMAKAWSEQQTDAKLMPLAFDERFAMLVDAEYLARDNRRLKRLLKDAQLRISSACIEDVEASAARGLERSTLAQFRSCAWVAEHLNVLISGPTGVGKSYLACALGQLACRRGYRVVYRRLPRLLEELGLARAEVLVLDDLGIGTLKDAQRQDLLEVFEDRYGKTSTVVTSQLPVAKWHEWIGDPTLADAILDRLVHGAYKLTLKGASRRKEKAQQAD